MWLQANSFKVITSRKVLCFKFHSGLELKNAIKSYFLNRSERHFVRVESYSSGRLFLLAAGSSLGIAPFYLSMRFGYNHLPVILAEFILSLLSFSLLLISLTGWYRPDFSHGLVIYVLSFSTEVISFVLVPWSSMLFLEIIIACNAVSAAVIIAQFKGFAERIHLRSFIVGTIVASVIILVILMMSVAQFPTDESVIDYYSARLFLEGLDPYIRGSLYGLLPALGFTLDMTTPLSTGGFVQALGYPALAFLSYIPAVIFHIKEGFIQIPLYVLPFLLISYNFMKKGYSNYIPFIALSIFSTMQFFYEGLTIGNSIFWVSLLMASFIMERKPLVSGALLGVSSSFKQFPLIVLPFLAIYMIKTHGRNALSKWVLAFAAIFILINAYFIFQDPVAFITSIVSPETSLIIGVGSGISQLSFAGYFSISREFFFLIMVYISLFAVIGYWIYFKRVKYCLFVIPVIIFLFNYRLLVQYVMFWPIIALLVFPDIMREKHDEDAVKESEKPIKRKYERSTMSRLFRNILVASVILIIVPTAAFLEVSHTNSHFSINSVRIESVSPLNSSIVDEMVVNLTYIGYENGSIPVLFRIMPSGPMNNVNNMLWYNSSSQRIDIHQTETFLIMPYNTTQFLTVGQQFRIIAYFGNIMGEKTVIQ